MTTDMLVINREMDGWIAAWLDAKRGKSQSERTYETYRQTMQQFRTHLWQMGLDLDSDPAKVAVVAEIWAKRSHAAGVPPDATVSGATANLRLATLSSFYRYWQQKQKERNVPNPIKRAERSKVTEYAGAAALETSQIAGLKRIDRATPIGRRDYALLQVALKTGRRASELAALRKETVNGKPVIRDDGERITLYFKRCKGNKDMTDRLSLVVSAIVRTWIAQQYGNLEQMPTGAPLWPSLSPRNPGRAISIDTIARLCKQYLGTSKIHATRHTFAHTMEEAGAKVSVIAARLGHANPAITGRYLVALRKPDNPYAEDLDRLMGL